MDSKPSLKALSWVGSCPAPNMLPWVGFLSPLPRFTIFAHTMPLPEGPGVAASVECFGALAVTPRGNTYILLFTDRFSHWADMFPVNAAEFTAEGTANILVSQCIPLWGCPRTILSDNGLQFCLNLSQAVYQLLGAHKLATSSYYPN